MIPIPRFTLAGFALALFALTAPNSSAASMQDYLASAPFKMPAVPVPVFPEHNFPITDFGAVGAGHTLNPAAFSKAIDACAQAGGGHVVGPAGL